MRSSPPPDPGGAATLDDLVERLRSLRSWSGDPSFTAIAGRVNQGRPGSDAVGRTTVVDCFRPGRRRLDTDLVTGIVRALHPDPGYVAQWRQVLVIISRERQAAAQVRVYDTLPPDLPGFTGREADLRRLREALAGSGRAIAAIEGMAGVGKTRLAVRAAHLLHRERPYERVLFVNLRGFHPDPGQPAAEAAAVLDGFLRLLGVPGPEISHDLAARARQFREVLAGRRALLVLDNAADPEQVKPLLGGAPALVTSRRSLDALRPAVTLAMDVFSRHEAQSFLIAQAGPAEAGEEPEALARVAALCGRLPLALGLVAAQMRARPGWTWSDHADRLHERRDERRLDDGVELALNVSYQRLTPGLRRMLRLVALHPADDFDAYAVAALAGSEVDAARIGLRTLQEDHLIQPSGGNRYTLHDLIRLHSTVRAHDEERPAERRAALNRLLDHYLATAVEAMRILRPADSREQPTLDIDRPPVPLAGPDEAREWVRAERQAVVSIAADAAARGFHRRVAALSATFGPYFNTAFGDEAVALHEVALRAATAAGDEADIARAHLSLGSAHAQSGRIDRAVHHYTAAQEGFRRLDDRPLHARALMSVGLTEIYLGRHEPAATHLSEALSLIDPADNGLLAGRILHNLAEIEKMAGRYDEAADQFARAWELRRPLGDRTDEAHYLEAMGEIETRRGRPGTAVEHLTRAAGIFREAGNRYSVGHTLINLGTAYLRHGRPEVGIGCFIEALSIYRGSSNLDRQAAAHNGLGEAAAASGRPEEALREHAAALDLARRGHRPIEEAHAHTGAFHAHHAVGRHAAAEEHRRAAVRLYTELGMPEADRLTS